MIAIVSVSDLHLANQREQVVHVPASQRATVTPFTVTSIITARIRTLQEGNVFNSVCLSVQKGYAFTLDAID